MDVRRRKSSFIPRLEALEDRRCPSVTSSMDGGDLNINGNAAADAVRVVALDNSTFQVTANGQTRTFNDVNNVNIDLGDGNNSVIVLLSALRNTDSPNISIRGGSGNDRVTINTGQVQIDQINLDVDLGDGNNAFRLQDSGFAEDEQINLKLRTGNGNDTAYINNIGRMQEDSGMNLDVQQGDGNDFFRLDLGVLDQRVNVKVNLDTGSGNDQAYFNLRNTINDRANIEFDVNMDDGNDRLFVNTNGFANSNANINVNADGGDGNDTAMLRGGASGDNVDFSLNNFEREIGFDGLDT